MSPSGLAVYQQGTAGHVRATAPEAGSIFSVVGRAIKGFATGGPLGAVAGALNRPAAVARPAVLNLGGGPQPVLRTPGVTGALQRLVPGGATGYQVGGGGGGGSCMKKDGTPRRVRQDGKCWKRPSMNVGNARAARRAIARIKGVRHMLQAIEREMPKRPASSAKGKRCGCK